MKYFHILIFLLCSSALTTKAVAQDSINPYNIQQSCTITLQNTDVYYNPMKPPGPLDSGQNLSNQSIMIRDSDGMNVNYPKYGPIINDSGSHFVMLQNWHPYGDTLGPTAVWQRLFQARNQPGGAPSDIIAGGGVGDWVTVSKNEDVDFRASGRIKLKSGFHVKPGAFFHAYTEPKWDTAVFSDEFNDTAKFRNQWHVGGHGGNNYPQGLQCDNDTNVYLDTDYQAHDGHALDIIIREFRDSENSPILTDTAFDKCQNYSLIPYDTDRFVFSSGFIRSCPFPFTQLDTFPLTAAYAHVPYGKYEIREKIPHVIHHTNNWGGSWNYGYEFDLNETDYNGNIMDTISPGFSHQFQYGPFQGSFGTVHDTVIFTSSQPEWCLSNNPNAIIINNVAYQVQFVPHHGMDTVMAASWTQNMGWPSSLTSPHGSFSFNYSIANPYTSDIFPWRVDTDSHGKWRYFSTPGYHINRAGDTLHFTKTHQPNSITLTTGFGIQKSFGCHWEYNLNHPHDSGKLYLDDTMAPGDLHSGTEAYSFNIDDIYSPHNSYPIPPLLFNGMDTVSGYQYHTYAMELLPHEIRYLVDSVVVRRFPDRLVPNTNPYYDFANSLPRGMVAINPAETDIDVGIKDTFARNDTVAWVSGGVTYYKSITYEEYHYFDTHPYNPGCWDVEIPPGSGHWVHAAHHLIDYVKVWDVPKDVIIPNYPQ